MAKDFKFDPITKDLIKDGKGSYVLTEHADTVAQLQLQCHAGDCWQDETLGSYLHDLKRFQAKPEVLLPVEVRRSLNVLESRGRIGNIAVVAERRGPGRVDVASKFRDTSTGRTITLKSGG